MHKQRRLLIVKIKSSPPTSIPPSLRRDSTLTLSNSGNKLNIGSLINAIEPPVRADERSFTSQTEQILPVMFFLGEKNC